jgi:CRP-like cAMP-binding protein
MIEQITLLQFRFFADLPTEALSDIALASRLLTFEPATVIFHSGDEADTLYGVIEGKVNLSLETIDKKLATRVEFEEAVDIRVVEQASQISVDIALPGNIFGWSALAGGGRRTVTATSTQSTKVIAIPAQHLKALCEKNHTLGYELMKRLVDFISKRLDNRNKRLIEVWVETFGVSKVSL